MTNTVDLNRCYDFIMDLVDEAGKIIASRNSERKITVTKLSPIDFVTETDKEIEALLIGRLNTEFPDHKFIGEESVSDSGVDEKVILTNKPTWIIDPVDGTTNFVHGYPQSCISVALYVKQIAEIGIVFNPVLCQKFTARRGLGAYLNGQRIAVSETKRLQDALVSTEFGSSRDEAKREVVLENLRKVTTACHGLRMAGSGALNMSYVALGVTDAHYEFGMHVWDMAAAQLLVREAGGIFIDPCGGTLDIMSRRVLCASSLELATELSTLLTQYYPKPRDDD